MIPNLIIFIFLGHSNMLSNCSGETIAFSPHVYMWDYGNGWVKKSTGGPVVQFLNRMALLYPGKNFGGWQLAQSGKRVNEFFEPGSNLGVFERNIDTIKKQGIIGGVMCMYGFLEGGRLDYALSFPCEYMRLIWYLRAKVGNFNLPIMVGRYEINGEKKSSVLKYYRYDRSIVFGLNQIVERDPFIKLFPIRDLPKGYYCEDHHSASIGYKIQAEDASVLYQLAQYDTIWHPTRTAWTWWFDSVAREDGLKKGKR